MNLDRATPGKNIPDEANKWVTIEDWEDRNAAYEEILPSVERFKNAPVKPCF